MPCCLVGLGANLADRQRTIEAALRAIGQHPRMRVCRHSTLHETLPAGGPLGQEAFLNGAALIETSLPPHEVLDALQRIESELGRERLQRWGPRTVDLDLLLYEELELQTPTLVLPHPRMAWRRFVLEPAAEVAAAMVHPTTGWTVERLLKHLDTTFPYVALAGSIGAGKTHLAGQLAQKAATRLLLEEVDAQRLGTFYSDPSGQGWATELEFLDERTRLLALAAGQWQDRNHPVVSDFWYDQSLAFAQVWLAPDQFDAFAARFEQSRPKVRRPRLIVLLEASADWLRQRVMHRGRPSERRLSEKRLDAIQRALVAQVSKPDQGPVLRLPAADSDRALDEVTAAMEAMK